MDSLWQNNSTIDVFSLISFIFHKEIIKNFIFDRTCLIFIKLKLKIEASTIKQFSILIVFIQRKLLKILIKMKYTNLKNGFSSIHSFNNY